MHRASYCNVYISRPTRSTNSYNVSLFIINCSTCFGLFSPSSGATFGAVYRNWYKPVPYVWLLPDICLLRTDTLHNTYRLVVFGGNIIIQPTTKYSGMSVIKKLKIVTFSVLNLSINWLEVRLTLPFSQLQSFQSSRRCSHKSLKEKVYFENLCKGFKMKQYFPVSRTTNTYQLKLISKIIESLIRNTSFVILAGEDSNRSTGNAIVI